MGDLGAARRRAAVDERRAAGGAAWVVGAGEVGIGEVRPGAAPDAAEASVPMRLQPGLGVDLDVVRRQLADEARGDGALPGAVDAAVGGEGDGGAVARAGDADIGEPALLLQPGETGVVHPAPAREQPPPPGPPGKAFRFGALRAAPARIPDYLRARL